jgi:hypothetical protein
MVKSKFTTLDSTTLPMANAPTSFELEQCVVVINQAQIDKTKNHNYFEKLFEGLESMQPEVVVMIGDFNSQEGQEVNNYDKQR